ncbi:HNH endonuclease [Flavobacterium procerum]|uniref:HNH endonuclease n=1 Tax=Flavobacterium procerum TaxID=1455569 RepID=A0ABV6BQN2_9FLAO
MNWKIIVKSPENLLTERLYQECKEDLSREAEHRCIYCCIHESRFGGIRNFHVEHYKPKSKYDKLKNTYSNLFYSCSICNCFKGNDWPNDPDDVYEKPFYPDPLIVNYSDYMMVDYETGFVEGLRKTTKYVVEKLYLNRPQLVNERKFFGLMEKMRLNYQLLENIELRMSNASQEERIRVMDLFIKATSAMREISQLQIKLQTVNPYTIVQVRR